MPTQDNCVKKSTGHEKLDRVVRISEEFNRRDFNRQCKANKCSLNEAIRGILGVTVKEYAMRHNDPDFNEMGIIQTNALIGLPQTAKEMVFGNNWVA